MATGNSTLARARSLRYSPAPSWKQASGEYIGERRIFSNSGSSRRGSLPSRKYHARLNTYNRGMEVSSPAIFHSASAASPSFSLPSMPYFPSGEQWPRYQVIFARRFRSRVARLRVTGSAPDRRTLIELEFNRVSVLDESRKRSNSIWCDGTTLEMLTLVGNFTRSIGGKANEFG